MRLGVGWDKKALFNDIRKEHKMGTEKNVKADKVEMVTKKGLMSTLRQLFVKEETEVKVEKNIQINRNGIIVHCKNCRCNVFSKLEGGNYSCNRCGTIYNVVKDE